MLNINLTEPIVFLRRSHDLPATRRHQPQINSSAVVRGVLSLKLTKATKIKSIDIKLVGTARTEWPEGIGPRRAEVVEDTPLLYLHNTLFSTKPATTPGANRRALSLGPGVDPARDEDDDYERVFEESDEEDDAHPSRPPLLSRTSSNSSSASTAAAPRRGASVDQYGRMRYLDGRQGSPLTMSPINTPDGSSTELHEATSSNQARGSSHNTLVERSNQSSSPRASGIVQPTSRPSSSRSRPRQSLPAFPESDAISHTTPSSPASHAISPELTRTTSDERSGNDVEGILNHSTPPPTTRRLSFDLNNLTNGTRNSRPSPRPSTSVDNSPLSTPNLQRRPLPSEEAWPDRSKRFSFGVAWQEMKDLVSKTAKKTGSHVAPNSETNEDGERGRTRKRDLNVAHKIGEVLGLETHHDEKDVSWTEFRKGTYNWPISFVIPPNCPPTARCEYGSVIYKLIATVKRSGRLIPNVSVAAEVKLVACPAEDDTETESIIVEREWEDQLRYMISLSGKSFPIGSSIPMNLTLLPLAKISVIRISVVLDEKIDYFACGRKVARHDPLRRLQLFTVKPPGKDDKLLPILSDASDAAASSPLEPYIEGETPSDRAEKLLAPSGPWSLRADIPVPDCSTNIHSDIKHGKVHIIVSHSLKIVMRVARGDDEQLDAKGKRKQFDIIVETPIRLLSCLCRPEIMSLPTYSMVQRGDSNRPMDCACEPRGRLPESRGSSRSASREPVSRNPPHNASMVMYDPYLGALPSPSRSPFPAGLDLPQHHHGHHSRDFAPPVPPMFSHSSHRSRSPSRGRVSNRQQSKDPAVEGLEQLTKQYARLVSGEELTSGETPPSYQEAVVNRSTAGGSSTVVEANATSSSSASGNQPPSVARRAISRGTGRPSTAG